jgi:hypothetical protein
MQNWTLQETISPAEEFITDYRIKVGDSYETRVDRVSFVAVSETLTEYETLEYYDKDGKKQSQDVVANTVSVTTTCVGAANPTRWKSKLEAGSPSFPGQILEKRTLVYHKYILTEDGPVEREVTTYEYEPRIAFAGGLAIENYKNIDLGIGNILLRKTVVDKLDNKAADLTLQITTIYEAWGATAGGKTGASVIMAGIKRAADADRISGTYALVDRMSALVFRGVEKSINIGRGTAPAQPSKLDQQNDKLKGAQDALNVNGGWLQTNPNGNPYKSQLTDLSFGSDGTNSTDKYDMQFAPDSYLRPSTDAGDNGTGLNYVYVSSATAAYEYGKAIYTILSGMANGKSLTTELRNLPSEPMGTLYLEAAGTVGRFRANGTTFAFDSQGLIAGCDAMLDGGAGLVTGASGSDWFPMMVPATNLPTVTPAANNSPALANTISAPSGFDPNAPGNIWTSFGIAGVEGDIYAVELTRASVVGAMAENVRRESVSRSLSWLLEAPYNVSPVVESGTSTARAFGEFVQFLRNDLYAGAGAGAITNLSAIAATQFNLLAGSGAGAITTLTAASAVTTTGQRASGTQAPLLGASPAGDFTGWSRVVNADTDDNFIAFSGWQFNVLINSNAYSACFIGANNYVTFGFGSTQYLDLSASNPSLPKIHLGSMDGSFQRVYTQTAAGYSRLRIEGSENRLVTQPGNSDRITEVTFWKPTNSEQMIEIRTGGFTGSSEPFMIASTSTAYASATTLGANQSWVFVGNSTGTSWTLYANSYVVT